MTTSSPDNSSTTPSEPAAQQPEGRRRWNSATSVALAVAVVGAVAAAVLSPLGEHVVNAFLDEPTCPGEACEGKNPGRQGCDEGATTFKPAAGNPAELSIRYSKDCQAVWGKIERGAKGDLVTVEATGGTKRAAEIGYGDDQYTPMVRVGDGEFEVTACAVPKAGGESTYELYCVHGSEATAWR
ncbi:DUF2690 domain-containing protein [Streptomyces pseudogriseolus]|uniref:DUF2690 domain-containing protein n=1 Tax=Streptomyces pseudogriseolus TaxID=36817 RepID=UPI003FA33DEA